MNLSESEEVLPFRVSIQLVFPSFCRTNLSFWFSQAIPLVVIGMSISVCPVGLVTFFFKLKSSLGNNEAYSPQGLATASGSSVFPDTLVDLTMSLLSTAPGQSDWASDSDKS